MTRAADNELWDWVSDLERDGRCTPEEFVEAARDPDSPAHALLEWDDAKAGHKYRVEQARHILSRRIVIRVETHKLEVPRYVRDPSAKPDEQSYINVRRASVEDLQQEILAREFERVAQHLDRARALAKFFGLQEEVDSMIEQLGLIRDRLPAPETRM